MRIEVQNDIYTQPLKKYYK
ncbi:predicted protein [Aspergillus nidulans FGSC A4]|nr:predicted protein [Aspergillus nidulans FGSC A4]|eukprot:XP_868834.1 predicted protein [Aspergillus nidulans FGSC A4]